jgi:hypothetical protein
VTRLERLGWTLEELGWTLEETVKPAIVEHASLRCKGMVPNGVDLFAPYGDLVESLDTTMLRPFPRGPAISQIDLLVREIVVEPTWATTSGSRAE